MLLIAAGSLWLFLAAVPALADGGPHVASTNSGVSTLTADSCAGCHRAHTAQGEMLINATDEEELCLTCHGAAVTGATTDVMTGIQYAHRRPAASAGHPVGALRGGGFDQARIDAGSMTRLAYVPASATRERLAAPEGRRRPARRSARHVGAHRQLDRQRPDPARTSRGATAPPAPAPGHGRRSAARPATTRMGTGSTASSTCSARTRRSPRLDRRHPSASYGCQPPTDVNRSRRTAFSRRQRLADTDLHGLGLTACSSVTLITVTGRRWRTGSHVGVPTRLRNTGSPSPSTLGGAASIITPAGPAARSPGSAAFRSRTRPCRCRRHPQLHRHAGQGRHRNAPTAPRATYLLYASQVLEAARAGTFNGMPPATTRRRAATTSPATCRGTRASTTPRATRRRLTPTPATRMRDGQQRPERPPVDVQRPDHPVVRLVPHPVLRQQQPDRSRPLPTGRHRGVVAVPAAGRLPVQPPAPDRRGPGLPDLPRLPWLQRRDDRHVLEPASRTPTRTGGRARSVGLEPAAQGRQPRHLPGLPRPDAHRRGRDAPADRGANTSRSPDLYRLVVAGDHVPATTTLRRPSQRRTASRPKGVAR